MTYMKSFKNVFLIVLAFFSIYVIWGSTYFLNKVALSELPPFMIASSRFLTAGSLIFLVAKLMGLSLRITTKQLLNCTIAGLLFLTFGNGLVVWALKYVDSGITALEISAQPLVVLLMMRILQGKKIESMSVVGIILGVIGIYLLVGQKQMISHENTIYGMIMIFVCMLSWAYGSLFVAKAELPGNFFINTGYQMFMGGLMLLLVSLSLGENWKAPMEWGFEIQLTMTALILFGSIVAFTSFNYLLRHVSPEKVATSTYVNPIIALFLGWYYLDEIISQQSIIAAVVLLTGVYFINTNKKILFFSRFKK